VATEYSKGEREFWWDELERLVLTAPELPESLQLELNGTSVKWNASDSRQQLYQQLGDSLRPLPSAKRFDVLGELQRWSGMNAAPRASHRALSPEEIRQLADGGLVEIGAHTITHPVLSAISIAQQQQEITDGKTQLEQMLNQPVASFAYPYGTRDDYTRDSVAIVKRASFSCACSNFKGVVQPRTSLYELPRFVVRDWDGDEFERNLRGWFRG
jgi:hypothetical protein